MPPPGMDQGEYPPPAMGDDRDISKMRTAPAGLSGLVAFNSAQSQASAFNPRADHLQYSASAVSAGSGGAAGMPPTLMPREPAQTSLEAMSVHKIRLLELCQKHGVDLRTIEWFALPENSIYWETLARKLEEIDRRSTMGDGHFKVKNPSAWLTKFFNTIKKQGVQNLNMGGAGAHAMPPSFPPPQGSPFNGQDPAAYANGQPSGPFFM